MYLTSKPSIFYLQLFQLRLQLFHLTRVRGWLDAKQVEEVQPETIPYRHEWERTLENEVGVFTCIRQAWPWWEPRREERRKVLRSTSKTEDRPTFSEWRGSMLHRCAQEAPRRTLLALQQPPKTFKLYSIQVYAVLHFCRTKQNISILNKKTTLKTELWLVT